VPFRDAQNCHAEHRRLRVQRRARSTDRVRLQLITYPTHNNAARALSRSREERIRESPHATEIARLDRRYSTRSRPPTSRHSSCSLADARRRLLLPLGIDSLSDSLSSPSTVVGRHPPTSRRAAKVLVGGSFFVRGRPSRSSQDVTHSPLVVGSIPTGPTEKPFVTQGCVLDRAAGARPERPCRVGARDGSGCLCSDAIDGSEPWKPDAITQYFTAFGAGSGSNILTSIT
jgi:hypothetical protein